MTPCEWPELFQNSLESVAQFFHVDSSRIVITPGCTSALQLAIVDQPWQPGDQVMTSSFEHHAVYRNLVRLKSQGIDVVQIPPDAENVFDLEFAEEKLKGGKTKLIAVTAACNVTGAILPLKRIIELAHHYGARVLIDGAQIAGWWDLDLQDMNVDFFAFAGHKGPQAPWGIGGLYVAETAKMNCPGATCEFTSYGHSEFENKPGYCDAGSVDMVALAGLAAGCRWLSSEQNESRLATARSTASILSELLRDFAGARLIHDLGFENKMPTVAVDFGTANQRIVEKLKAKRIIVSSGFQCAPMAHRTLDTAEHGVIRFSFGPVELDIDFDLILKTISEEFSG